jgi:hypothetical protein
MYIIVKIPFLKKENVYFYYDGTLIDATKEIGLEVNAEKTK